jgi:hypothetical protein
MAKKLLKIVKQEKTYAICPDCDTLYKVLEILQNRSDTEPKCRHVEFSNHPKHSKRQACEAELTNKVLIVNRFTRKPKMLFLVLFLKTQIISIYQHSGFIELLQKWLNQINVANLYTDIYDREV